MKSPPIKIDGANVILFTTIDERQKHTSRTRHFVESKLIGDFPKLAICQYEGQELCYLFYCNESWESITDTLHDNLKEAKEQAEFEYEGVSETWQKI